MTDLMKQISEYIDLHTDEMLEDIKTLCRINSERMAPEEGAPYGPGAKAALEEMMAICEKHGFAVKNYDGYVGTADLSDAEKKLDILAHLDVVPVQDDWTVTEPFNPVVVDGNLYGRGTADDKGPAIAALYAMKAVKELGIPVHYSTRLIFGTDEECGSSDIEHYYAIEEEAPMTFSPDADFPLINIEKGSYHGHFTKTFAASDALPKLVNIEVGTKINVVPGKTTATVAGFDLATLEEYGKKAAEETKAVYTFTEKEGVTEILCVGEGAHAAHPEGGNNALTALVYFLTTLPFAECEGITALKEVYRLLPHGDYSGKAAGVAMEDELSGKLTLSFTMYRQNENSLEGFFDSRVPICGNEENMREVAAANFEAAGMNFERLPMNPPHHVSGESDFVKTLLASYEAFSGLKGECMAIGGGTYVHHLKNGVAFGCAMPGVDNRMHGADEFARVEDLVISAKIFALAISELCK